MANKRGTTSQAAAESGRKATAKQRGARGVVRTSLAPKNHSARQTKVVFDEWDTYVAMRGGTTMFISFDDIVTRGKRPAGLRLCARILVPIKAPNSAGGPVPPESKRLWEMEDNLCALLRKHKVRCRLVARLTYGGWRELVFQLHGWRSFRPPVGLWMLRFKNYDIDVSEHKGWDFFDEYVRPTPDDRRFMADRSVIDSLIENGTNPAKKHTLEFVFCGEAKGLRRIARALSKRGYKPLGKLVCDSGMIELSKRLPLDLSVITEETKRNDRLAQNAGVDFDGWGAAVVD